MNWSQVFLMVCIAIFVYGVMDYCKMAAARDAKKRLNDKAKIKVSCSECGRFNGAHRVECTFHKG